MEYTREDHERCYGPDRPIPSSLGRFLRFWGAVAVTVVLIYGVALALLSMQRVPVAMPSAKPVYESNEATRRLSSPCAVSYAHRGANGRWVQGCAK